MSCESFGAGPNSGSPEFNVGSDLAMHRNLHRASSRNTFTLTDDPIGADLSSPSQIHSSQQLLQPSTLIVSFPKFSSVQDEAAATDKIFDGASMLMEEKLKANEYHRYVARMVENQTGAHVEAFHLEESTMESVGLTSFKIRKAANELAPTFIIRGMPANVQSANEALLNQFSSSSSVIKFRIPEEAYGNESLIDRIDPEHRYDLSFAEDGPVLEVKEGLYSIEEIRTKCRLEIHKLVLKLAVSCALVSNLSFL